MKKKILSQFLKVTLIAIVITLFMSVIVFYELFKNDQKPVEEKDCDSCPAECKFIKSECDRCRYDEPFPVQSLIVII